MNAMRTVLKQRITHMVNQAADSHIAFMHINTVSGNHHWCMQRSLFARYALHADTYRLNRRNK